MGLVVGKKKEFNLILSKSGNGKTVLEYLLMKAKQKPTIIIDNYNQFKGYHKSLKELSAYFLDFDNVEDYTTLKRQIIVSLKPDESGAFFDYLLASKFLGGSLIVCDEIDMVLGTANVSNAHPFYEFCNRGRHLEYNLIATSRATQNVPKCLTQQTDVYYIGKIQNKPMLDYLTLNTNIKDIEELCEALNPYQFLQYNTETEQTKKVMLNSDLLSLFD